MDQIRAVAGEVGGGGNTTCILSCKEEIFRINKGSGKTIRFINSCFHRIFLFAEAWCVYMEQHNKYFAQRGLWEFGLAIFCFLYGHLVWGQLIWIDGDFLGMGQL